MDDIHRQVLSACWEDLVQDLDVTPIMDQLTVSRIIKSEQKQMILCNNTRQARNRALLELLKELGPEAYDHFRKALLREKRWLVEKMDAEEDKLRDVDNLL